MSNNELRCYANEIILKLHKERELGQIQLLLMACILALKDLDRAAYRETIENHHAALASTGSVNGYPAVEGDY